MRNIIANANASHQHCTNTNLFIIKCYTYLRQCGADVSYTSPLFCVFIFLLAKSVDCFVHNLRESADTDEAG